LLGIACLGMGWFAYRSEDAPRLLRDQLLIRAMPGTLCGLPVAGAGLFAFALSFWLPSVPRLVAVLLSSLTTFVGVMLFGWCPARLLPRWLRATDPHFAGD